MKSEEKKKVKKFSSFCALKGIWQEGTHTLTHTLILLIFLFSYGTSFLSIRSPSSQFTHFPLFSVDASFPSNHYNFSTFLPFQLQAASKFTLNFTVNDVTRFLFFSYSIHCSIINVDAKEFIPSSFISFSSNHQHVSRT
jgi:hypothetical protein